MNRFYTLLLTLYSYFTYFTHLLTRYSYFKKKSFTLPLKGPPQTYEQAVLNFDVAAFAEMVAHTGFIHFSPLYYYYLGWLVVPH